MANNAPFYTGTNDPTGAGNVVGVRVNDRVFHLMVGPNDDAGSLLRQLGVSVTRGHKSEPENRADGVGAEGARYVLRQIDPNVPAKLFTGPAGTPLPAPTLEIVDLNGDPIPLRGI